MEAVVLDFGDKNPREDPVIHFYELVPQGVRRQEADAARCLLHPRPVVSFIVRSVDELLRTEFGLEDGLADTTTWGEMVERNTDLEIPEGGLTGTVFCSNSRPGYWNWYLPSGGD